MFDYHYCEVVGNAHSLLGKLLDVESEIAKVEFLAELEVVHLVENVTFDGLGQLAHLFLEEIYAVGLLTDKPRRLEIVT